jgi:hypothetical protein
VAVTGSNIASKQVLEMGFVIDLSAQNRAGGVLIK